MTKELYKAKNDFQNKARMYQFDRSQAKDWDPRYFQQHLSTTVKELIETQLENLPEITTKNFEIPDAEWMEKQPDFLANAAEIVTPKAAARDIQELRARSFLINMMLGQVMDRAAKLAEQAYNKVMLPAFDKIGACFCMSGKAFYQELQDFIKGSAAKGKIPQDNEDVLIDFVDREHFKLMYMGCVLWSALPLAYSNRGSKKSGVQLERGVQTAVPEEPRYDPAMFVFYGQRPWQNQHGNV